MAESKGLLQRMDVRFQPDANRVICLFYNDRKEDIIRIHNHFKSMTSAEVEELYSRLSNEFSWRHRDFDLILDRHCAKIAEIYNVCADMDTTEKRAFAGFFTMEYSIEAAALFNPSIVPHPDQSGLEEGAQRFIMTLRAVGEGHISSVEFKCGIIDRENNITLDEQTEFVTIESELIKNPEDKGYVELKFDDVTLLGERVIFPVSPEEANGIEDVRMVKFSDNNEDYYYGTFTAFDGNNIRPKLIETRDFLNFKIIPLLGSEVKDKGMALFPRKINGKYAVVSRQDGVNLWMMYSDDLNTWNEKELMLGPKEIWQFSKIGNCGSPLETEHGWLLLTHGVGAVRKYEIGICLLDKDDPGKVIACLKEPLISPNEEEREGYVPNVVYTCGAILHNKHLIIPYAMSDAFTGFASVNVDDLISRMTKL